MLSLALSTVLEPSQKRLNSLSPTSIYANGNSVLFLLDFVMKMELISMKIVISGARDLEKQNVFRTQIRNLRISSFPIGKVDILRLQNCVLKTLWIHSMIRSIFMECHENRPNYAMNSQCFWTGISNLRISSIPIGILDILRLQNGVPKTFIFAMECSISYGNHYES